MSIAVWFSADIVCQSFLCPAIRPKRACGREPRIEQLADQPGDVSHTHADITRARNLLGYEPQEDLEDGLAEFVHWWRERFRT